MVALMLTLGMGVAGLAPGASADTPAGAMAQTKAMADEVLGVVRDPACQSNQQACRRKLREIVEAHWDVTEMTRSALGVHWKGLDDEQRREFTKLFGTLMEAIYLSRANLSKAQDYSRGTKVDFIKEIPEGDGYAQVNTNVTRQSKPISVNYRLKLNDRSWMVYDVIVEGISLVNNYRTQFNRVINGKGYPELVRELRGKLQQIDGAQGT